MITTFPNECNQDRKVFEALKSLALQGEGVCELRHLAKPVASGFFDDPAEAAKAAPAENVYYSLNPICQLPFLDAPNEIKPRGRGATDKDVLCRVWLPIDVDPIRPADCPSTDAEHEAVLARAADIRDWLCEKHAWPWPVEIDSGNGAHLMYRIDLPNDPESKSLIRNVLARLSERFSDSVCKVDTSVYNASRIMRLPGTRNRKGQATEERPHRAPACCELCCQSS